MSLQLVSIGNANVPGSLPPFDPETGKINKDAAVSSLRNLVSKWRDDPVAFARESFTSDPSGHPVVVDDQQARLLQAVAHHDRVACRTGRGIGKTAAAAILVAWWLATRYPARVVTSAGTWNHLEDKLWPEIRTWSHSWLLSEAYEYQQLGIYAKADPDGWRAVASSSDRAENVEGHHSPHLLLLIDEAKGMPDEIFAALLASLTNAGPDEEQKVVALSTPPLSRVGWFSRVSSSPDWHVEHVSGLDSPRVSSTYVEEIRNEFGESSPQYQSYVLGEIPEGVAESVIQSRWIEAAQKLEIADTRPCVITCDVAREGEDLTVIGRLENARFALTYHDDSEHWGWFTNLDLMQVSSRCAFAIRKYKPSAILIDDTGLGGGVTDRLRQMQADKMLPSNLSIIPIKFGSIAEREDRFKQCKDELWWAAREAIRTNQLALPTDAEIRDWSLPRGSDFKSQLSSPIYEYDTRDRIDVLDRRQGNREKTRALPSKSPDLAHALILGAKYYLRQPNKVVVPAGDPQYPTMDQDSEIRALMRKSVEKAMGKQQGVRNPYKGGR